MENIMKRIILVLSILVLSLGIYGQELKCASYNMLRLGSNNGKDYTTLAKVVSNFDIVGSIEVMNPSGLNSLVSNLPGWKYVISDHAVGDKSYKEYDKSADKAYKEYRNIISKTYRQLVKQKKNRVKAWK
jgi:iron uptake system EfeUOB component EfeO/EfeM